MRRGPGRKAESSLKFPLGTYGLRRNLIHPLIDTNILKASEEPSWRMIFTITSTMPVYCPGLDAARRVLITARVNH